jgi:hypothetical protein
VDTVKELQQASRLLQWHMAAGLVCPQATITSLLPLMVPPSDHQQSLVVNTQTTGTAGTGTAGAGTAGAGTAGAVAAGTAGAGTGPAGTGVGGLLRVPSSPTAGVGVGGVGGGGGEDLALLGVSLWLPVLLGASLVAPYLSTVAALRALSTGYCTRALGVLAALGNKGSDVTGPSGAGGVGVGVGVGVGGGAVAPGGRDGVHGRGGSAPSPIGAQRSPSPVPMSAPSSPSMAPHAIISTASQGPREWGVGSAEAGGLRVGDVDLSVCAGPLRALLHAGLQYVVTHGVLGVPRWVGWQRGRADSDDDRGGVGRGGDGEDLSAPGNGVVWDARLEANVVAAVRGTSFTPVLPPWCVEPAPLFGL